MEGLVVLLLVPMIVFCVMVAPIWIVVHYWSRRRSGETSVEDKKKIEELLNMAASMEGRLVTLEAILDKQHPNWRHEI